MPSKSDHSAGDFETENAGGFLAEEEGLDGRALLRLGTWGAASVGAVVAALLVNHSGIALRREQLAAADLARQSQQIQSLSRESQNETRRLASAIDTLNSDRDRLFSRVGVLEQGLDSVTGAIARQASSPAPQAAAAPSAKTDPKPPAQNPAPAPVVAPVAATPAIPAASGVTERPVSSPAPQAAAAPSVKADAKSEPNTDTKTEPQVAAVNPPPVVVVAPLAPGAPAEKPGAMAAAEPTPARPLSTAPGDPNPPATPVTLMPAKSLMAPPDPAAAKLIEPEPRPDAVKAAPMPETVAAAPPSEDDAAPDAAPTERPNVAVQRTEFGADVGGANSLNGLRALWRGLVKSNKELADLRPIVVVKESNNGPGMQLRLVAGPLGDAAAAANICARLMESHKPCQTTVFDGQSLAMKADEPPAKPEVRSRNAAKRAAAEEPAKKPEFSASSWLFGKH